jgi:hypothetical protein
MTEPSTDRQEAWAVVCPQTAGVATCETGGMAIEKTGPIV